MRHAVRILLFQILCFVPVEVFAGGRGDSSRLTIFQNDVENVFRGIGRVYGAPLQWDVNDWMVACGLLSLTGGAFFLDDELRSVAFHNQRSFGDKLNAIGNFYGQSRWGLAFAGGTYAAGLIVNEPWVRGTGVVLLQTVISAGMLNLALKTLVGRSRPYENRGNTDFHPWAWEERFFSFPSGHAVIAFSVSSVLAGRIKNIWATVGLYSLAGITAWSRVYSDNHWFSDVVFGGLVTAAIGHSSVKWYEGENNKEEGSLSIIPTPSGCTLLLRF